MKVMKKNILIIVAITSLLFAYTGILSAQIYLPTVVTSAVSNITSTTAISGGNIQSDGGGSITARGICWAVTVNPTISNSKTSDGTGIGNFTSNIIGLLPSTTYHVRAYVTNCIGTAYGNDVTFTTLAGLAVVTTAPITSISQYSATTGGNALTYDISGKGVCWSTSPNPTLSDERTPGISGGGSFVSVISPLIPNTKYYIRAYATNGYGTAYGKQVTVILPLNQPGPEVTDRDNNIYSTVKIGNQAWMVQNLAVTQLNDGTSIANETDNAAWMALTTPAYCWYNNDAATYKTTYGALYNWYSVNTGKLCPTGWHVSSDPEWTTLTSYLGGGTIAGGKLKETGTTHWLSPNTGATNESGFTALPSGTRLDIFNYIGMNGFWWTSTVHSIPNFAYYWYMSQAGATVGPSGTYEYEGLSVRCVNDPPTATISGTTSICKNAASPYITFTGISGTPPYTFTYNINGGNNQFITTSSGNSVSVTVTTDTAGTFLYSLVGIEDVYSIAAATGNATVTINPTNTILLTSASNNPVFCVNTPVTKITYSTTGATGAIVSGLPAGLTSNFSCGIISITGTPTISGIFNYLVTPTGGCGLVNASGTITVNTLPTATTSYASAIASESVNLNGTINANNGNIDVKFEYGTTPVYGNSVTATPNTVTGATNTNVSANVVGLTANTTYHYRVVAVNPGCLIYGSDLTFTTTSKVTDFDGNSYNTVKIGSQLWFQENLKVLHYRNGDAIPNITNLTTWSNLISGGYCNYNNDVTNVSLYGRLYNAYATVDNRNLCPTGWHVPTEYEWIVLENYLIANGYNYDGTYTGNKIAKAMASETNWNFSSVDGAVGDTNYAAYRNKSGFSGIPAGFIYSNNTAYPGFNNLGSGAVWWSTTERIPSLTVTYSLWSDWVNGTHNDGDLKVFGFSVRCLQGEPIVVTNVKDDGPGSLRAAIVYANTNPGPDIIKFNIPGTGPFTIKPLSVLPTITGPVVIDGYSQPGASSATSTLLIQLDGTTSGAGSSGLTIDASNCTVEGLVITKFPLNGIQITTGASNWIRANSIYSNGRRGIALYGSVNNNQSFPVLDKTVINQGNIYIDGKLNSTPGKNFTLDFFASKLADSSSFGEGQNYLGSATVTTGGDGLVIFRDSILTYKTVYGDVITATATDPDRNTSEFSKAIGGLPDQKLNSLALVYKVNPNDARIDTGSISLAVKKSFNTWNEIATANLAFKYGGSTTEKYAHIDGENVVSFSDDQYEFGDWVLAITAKTLKLGATDSLNQILDADIIFNPYFVKHQEWNFGIADDMANVGFFDIQSITTHEIGHILGLLHTGVHNATMWFEMPQGIDPRSLEQDDKSWASYKYPLQPDYNNSFGSISGNITYGYDGNPVAGVLVLAINTATRDTVHGYSNADGSYLVPGLRPGSYNVYIEPLDGSVRNRPLYPRNISLYIYSNTIYTDYPGEFYSGANEKAQETTDIVTPVTVTTGSATSGIDFVTNKDMTPPVVVAVTPPDLKVSQDIIIKFSEPVDVSTFAGTTCYLIKSGNTKSIGGTYRVLGSQTNIVLFTPRDALEYSTNYTLHITAGITDLAKIPNNLSAEYQFSFKTGPGDKIPPTIVDIIPDNNIDNIFVDQKIMIFFSEPMNKTSVASSFSLNPAVNHTLSWDSESSILTFIPTPNYQEGTKYTFAISTGAKDLSGNAITSSLSFNFTTVPAANPTIIYLGPINNATAVTVTTPVVVDFSEPIDTLTITSGSFKLLKGSATGIPVQGKFEFLNDNSRVVFKPYTDLDFSQSYFIVLTTDIKDVSQTVSNLGVTSPSLFTTAAKPIKPVIDFIDPPSNHVGAEILIGGKGFDPDPAKNIVMFYGGKDLPTFQAVITNASLTSLKVQVPAGAQSGPISVTVNGAQADYSNPFDFYVIQSYADPCNELTGSAQTGGGSKGVTLDITAATAYVTNSGSNTVSVIDVATLTTKATINVGEYPLMIDMNPGGTRLYVTNFRSHTVSVIDAGTNAVVKTINVGYNPYGIKVSPDGKQVYVAHYNSEYENVSVIDADPASGGFDHVVANINTGTRNMDLAIDVNASTMVVTGDDGVKIIERAKTALGFDYSTYSASSGIKTKDAEIVSEAGIAVVSTMDGALLFIDINKGSDTFGAVIANSTSGGKAGDVKPDFSGVFLYVSNPYDNQVTVYKMTYGGGGGSEIGSYQGFKMTEYWKIPVGISPQGLVINTYNDQLFVANEFGTTGSTGSLTQVKICCAGKSPKEDIVAVTLYIRGMISRHTISSSLGNMLNVKLNDVLVLVAKGKTKTAISNLNAFISKVKDLRSNKQILYDEGQRLIDDANAIIAKLGISKGLTVTDMSDVGLSQPVEITESIPVSTLGIIYPNPFGESITINYEIAENVEILSKVQIMIYDNNGRLVNTLVDKLMQQGCYTTTWQGTYEKGGHAPFGTYFLRFRAGKTEEIRKILFIK
jgi:uncharacterized protein (TIGR02145 family)